MAIKFYKFILALFFATFGTIYAQTNASFRLNTITFQASEPQPDVLKTKLSGDGKVAAEPGIIFAYEAYASEIAALKISQSLIYDKAGHIAGGTSLMIKFQLIKAFKHSFSISAGPVMHYRQSWTDMEGYEPEPIYAEGEVDWQSKFSWISGELEYNYYLNKHTDLSISLVHIQAESVGLAIGVKKWINKKPRKKRGCISCPSFH